MKNPPQSNFRHITAPATSGFTLVEVLTVIAIISILMTAGAIGLGNLTAGKGTSSAVATCESLFDEARTIAVSKRCKARVMVDVNDPTGDNYLRRLVIAHEKIDPITGNAIENNWVLASRGYTMPTGTFFSRQYSKKDPSGDIDQDNVTLKNSEDTAMTNYSGNYVVYEFNSEGIFTAPGASFVIGSGSRTKTGSNPAPFTVSGAERDFAGFVIWRNGRTSAYRDPSQMGVPSTLAPKSNF